MAEEKQAAAEVKAVHVSTNGSRTRQSGELRAVEREGSTKRSVQLLREHCATENRALPAISAVK